MLHTSVLICHYPMNILGNNLLVNCQYIKIKTNPEIIDDLVVTNG